MGFMLSSLKLALLLVVQLYCVSSRAGKFILKNYGQQRNRISFCFIRIKSLLVLDPNLQYNIIASLKTNDHIDGFAITQDAKYAFVTNNKILNVYDFSNRKTFIQIGNDSSPAYTVDIIINQNQDTLYLFQVNGIVRILDISQKTNPNFAGQILWFPQQIYGGILSTDERFLILSQDNQGVGVFYLTKNNKQVTATILGSYPGVTQGNSHQVILTPDQNYLISLDQRNGLSFADFSVVQSKIPQNSPYQFNYYLTQWWPSQKILPSPYSLCLSSDGNFLFLGVRSIGIYTIDITDKKNPKQYMWAYFPFHGNSIALSPTQNYLYFSNSLSFMVFRKMQPTLGLKYVTLYNGNHSIGFNQSLTRYYWRCDYDPFRQVYIGAFDTDGLWLIDVSNPSEFNVIQSAYKPPNQNANIDVFQTLNKCQVLITSMNDGVNFMAVLDISNYKNIQVIQQVPLGEPFYGYIKDIEYSLDYKMVVCSLDRTVVFVDTQKIRQFQVITKWYFQPQMKGFTTGVMLSSDGKYFIGACRGYGYFVLDIQDLKNINLINYQESTGSEQVYKSLIFSYQFYLVDGLEGLYIMDQTKLPQLVAFSRLVVPGWTNDITFLNQEQTIIISTMQQGMIYLLDISDNKNPFIVSSFQYGDQNGMFTCSKQDFTTLFINNNLEVRRLPLTVSVMLHVDYIQVLGYTQSGDMQYSIIQNPETYEFLVGQTIKLNICTLYQSLDIVFSNIKLYQKQREYTLPSWIVFDPVEISLMITITNKAVDPTNLSQPLLNTLLVTTISPLYNQDFVFSSDKCTTNIEQATVIYLQFQEDGIIDDNNFVSPNIQYSSLQTIQIKDTTLFPNINQKAYRDCLSQQLKYKLLNALQNTPIYLKIKPSLNLKTSGSNQNYISSTALSVGVQIQIPKLQAKIIFKNEESISIQISSDQDILNITGGIQNINDYLQKKILIYPIPPQAYHDIVAVITVTDSMNYPIISSQSTSQFPFLAEKQNIQINPEKNLQTQFSDNILIQTPFEFIIDPKTFIVPDLKTTITYKILQQKGDQYVPLENSLWLQYNSDTFKFYGTPPQSAFKTSIIIQVTGSDGYTKVSQNFTIHVNQLPLMLVIQWIMAILGPLTGIFGLYKFRGDLYNILDNKRNKYSTITCKPNQSFILKIPLIIHENRTSILIMKELEAKLKKQETTKQQIIKIFKQKKPKNEQVSKKSWNKLLKISKFKTTMFQGIGKIQQMIQANMTAIAETYKKRLELLQKSERTSQIEKLYLKENGSIDYKLFLEHLLEFDIKFKMNNLETSTKSLLEESSTDHCVLFQCLKFQLARNLMCFDIKSQAVYSFLKHYSQVMNPNLTKNDWYKFLVSIQSTDDLDPLGHQIVFPEFSFYFTRLFDVLNLLDYKISQEVQDADLYLENLQQQLKEKIYDQIYESYDVNLYLIEQQMFADASGVVKTIPNSFFPSQGESIHIDPYQINALIALRYSPGPCICIEKALGLDYKPYGPQGNIQLPNWLELDTQPGLIILKGIPDFSNSEGILIRITTLQGYIIRHFILNVEEDVGEYKKLKQQLYQKKYILNSKQQKNNQTDSYSSQQKYLAYTKYRDMPHQDNIFFNPKQTQQNFANQQITNRSLNLKKSKPNIQLPDVEIQEEDQITNIQTSQQRININTQYHNLDSKITQPTLLTENINQKQMRKQVIKSLIAIYLICQVWCQIPQNWIYSPQYSYIIKSIGQQSNFSKIYVSPLTGLVFVSAGDTGVLVIDPYQAHKVIITVESTDNIIGFACTKDSRYLFMSNNQLLTIYELSGKNFTQLGQDQENVYIVDIKINEKEDTLFIFQIDGNVRILDISVKSNPVFAGNIIWYQQQIYGGLITPDDKYLILCQDSAGVGVFLLTKQKSQISGQLVGEFQGITQGYSHNVVITNDLKYLISLDERNGLSFADFSKVTDSDPNQYPYQFIYYLSQWWPSNVVVPSPYSFCLSADNNFLFLGVRSLGIFTIDIIDKTVPKTYMWSYFPYHGNSIALSPTANYLYFSNSKSLMVFRRMKPILGLKYVNLYNGAHSIGFDQSNTKYYWRCDYDYKRQVYIGAFDTDGLWFIDVSNPLYFNVIQKQYKPPGQNANIDIFYSKNEYKIMITSINDGVNFIAVLDVSDYNNIKVIQKIPYGQPFNGYTKDIDNTMDDTLIACALDRTIVFVDTETIGNYYVKAKWSFLKTMRGFTTGVMISFDGKYFVGACRGYGYYVLDIRNMSDIQMINYLDSTGAEQVYKSLTYSYQFYLVDGLQGLFIMDQTQLPQLTPFSQLVVDGWTNDITYLKQEKTVIISTMQQGQIYLLDISDNKNPFIVSSYQYGDENGMFTCSKPDYSVLFINNNNQVRQLPMTVSVYIHTDYLEVLGYSNSGDMKFNIINDPDTYKFKVGQTIKLNTCMLYQPLDLVVSSVTLYQKQSQRDLPSWIYFDPVEISLMIKITNDAVDPTNLPKPLLNTILFTTTRPLFEKDFQFDYGRCTTTKEQALAIFLQLKQDGMIDEKSLVSPDISFNDDQQILIKNTLLFPNQSKDQQIYNACISNLLKNTLLNSIQYTPIYLLIHPSLFLVLDGSTNNYISTQATDVSILIEIHKFQGYLIYKNSQSVNLQINSDQNVLNISGIYQNVNQFLASKIIIFPIPPQNYEEMLAEVTVMDQMNYPIQTNISVTQFPFLAKKQNIQNNPQKTLQSQFTDNIYILTEFGFIIDTKTFIVPDFDAVITYEVLIQKGDKFQQFDNTDWLTYNQASQKFYGTPPQSAFKTQLTIQVTASDGYTEVKQLFTIHVNKLPLMFVIQWIVTILGPLTGILGLYKNRSTLYNIFYSRRNQYSKLICKPNEKFILKIPLILEEYQAALQICHGLNKKLPLKKEQNKTEKNQQPKQRKSRILTLKSKVFEGVGKIQQIVTNDISSIAYPYKQRMQLQDQDIKKKKFIQLYLNTNGSINYEAFYNDLSKYDIKFKIGNTPTNTKSHIDGIKNESNLLYECLRFLLARKILSQDQKSKIVYEFLKKFSQIQDPSLTNNDWYKCLVKLESTEELNPQGHTIPFPNFSLYFKKLIQALTYLGIQIDQETNNLVTDEDINNLVKDKIFEIIYNNFQVNLYLIEKVMFSDSAGIIEKNPSSLFPSCGESIHISPHGINSVIALRYLPSGLCFEKNLGLDYKPYGPQGNMQLPSWLQLDLQPGLVMLKGRPEFQNTEIVLIRFKSEEGYIIRQFELQVEENLEELKKLRELIYKRKEQKIRDSICKSNIAQSTIQDQSLNLIDKKNSKYLRLIESKTMSPSFFSKQQSMSPKNNSNDEIIQFEDDEILYDEDLKLDSEGKQTQQSNTNTKRNQNSIQNELCKFI
ncbi:hypothetical protein ABPG72_008318 [Tetrahymena utriculariae]